MRLSELKTGEKGVIVKVLGHGGFRKRIVEMGFVKGKTVEAVLNAPLKDPVKYRVMGYEVSLRKAEAELVEIVSVEELKSHAKHFEKAGADTTACGELGESRMLEMAKDRRKYINVALVGNPNCGKTSLFNLASGAHEHVGNYGGVTVDAKEGHFDFQGYHFRIVDLPGTYSLSAYSPEEIYVRRHIIDNMPDVIINVIDTTNLERNLFFTTELVDMDVRMVCALNMYDEFEASGNELDTVQLSRLFGVPMIPTVCKSGKGLKQLFHTVIEIYEGADFLDGDGKMNPHILEDIRNWHKKYDPSHQFQPSGNENDGKSHVYRHIHVNHGIELEKSIKIVQDELKTNEELRFKYSTRFLAIKSLENDAEVNKIVSRLPDAAIVERLRNEQRARIAAELDEDAGSAIVDAKYGFIDGALKETFVDKHKDTRRITKALDSIFTNKYLGYPAFLLFMFIMFECTFQLGAYPQDWLDGLVGWLGTTVDDIMPEGPLKAMIVDGIIGGVGAVIVFLPQILILYLFISFMEDTGYMARAAFIMDKIMHRMGLHGKSFIPLLMGFGCNVPAIMATRTIESRKSRMVTMLIVPMMSCSARLPVYLLFVGLFFPKHGTLVLFSMYLIGVLLSVVLARIFSRFLIKGEDMPFVMELPPYRMPTAKAIFRHTWEKGKQYLKKMGGIILVASVIVWFLGYYPNHDAYATRTEQQENSYIGHIGKAIEPAIKPLGFDWQLGVGLLSATGAKELVVSTLGVLYGNDPDATEEDLAEKLNLSPLVAYCFMLFVLIYFPCIATIAAIKEESGKWKWALFTVFYTTALAWVVTFAVYQIGSLFV